MCSATVRGSSDVVVGPQVAIDSRLVETGALFVALPGEHVDGHDFVAAAAERGAAAALVTRAIEHPIAQLVVPDAVAALTDIARAVVAQESGRGLQTIGITGSSGKTTTKDITAQLLEQVGPTVAPIASFNNEIGAPLTACKVGADTDFLVMEMGAQVQGEIAHLCRMTPPQVGVVLNVGHAHLGYFGSREGIAQAKGELVEALEADGFAVLNYLDPLVWGMRSRTRARVVACAVGQRPEHELAVWAEGVEADELERCRFRLRAELTGAARRTEHLDAEIRLPLSGRHVVADAVQAAAAALCVGAPGEAIVAGLNGLVPRSRWRMEIHELAGDRLLINDAYNANPDSVAAAIGTLEALAASRRAEGRAARTWLLLGDMLELGEDSAALHRESGAAAASVDEVVAVGEFASDVIAGAGHGRVAESADAAADILHAELRDGDIVIIKGSNSTGLGRAGDAIVAGEEDR